jgi:hypothetical protein
MTPVHADHPEPRPLVQDQAPSVFGKDARHELPEASSLVLADQSVQGRATGTDAAGMPGSVDRVLGHASIGLPRSVRASAGPGDHVVAALDHDRRVAVPLLGQLRLDLRHRVWLRLEGRDALLDASL